jgi:hypothetical protein
MIFEIHQPELEAWLQQRNVQDVLMQAMRSAESEPDAAPPVKQNLADFLLQSPLAGSGIEIERIKDYPRPLDL